MQQQESWQKRDNDRAYRFLQRDPLSNFEMASALLHEPVRVVGLAESGAALVGVAIAGQRSGDAPPLVRLDAIGPVALRRLLSTLHVRPRRLLLHRAWLAESIEQELGPVQVRSGIEMFTAAEESMTVLTDERVRALTSRDIAELQSRAHNWMLDLVAEHLARGGQAFGIVEHGALLAQACCGNPTASMEEVCHVYTAPERRGQGLASAVVGEAIQAIVARGRQPVYFSRTANAASRRVAERCGLRHALSLQEVIVHVA